MDVEQRREPTTAGALEPFGHDPKDGVGLTLSGGGYRAMLFHLGVLEGLNTKGLLGRFDRISGVSGGTIPMALLGLRWKQLKFDAEGTATNFAALVSDPVRRLARVTVDVPVILASFLPGVNVSKRLARCYDKHLFDGAMLADLPGKGEGPRFVFNAASLQCGTLVRFSRPYVANYQIGIWKDPKVPLAVAIAASTGFPPFLSPLVLEGGDFEEPSEPFIREHGAPCLAEIQRRLILTDGGVYDNFGLETVWKRCRTVLVSDAGQRICPEVSPSRNWFSQLLRIREVFDDQARALRIRWIGDLLDHGRRDGAYFSIRGEIVSRRHWDDGLAAPPDLRKLAFLSTRLASMPEETIDAIVSWGRSQAQATLEQAKARGALGGLERPREEGMAGTPA